VVSSQQGGPWQVIPLYLQLFILVILRETQVEPSTFRPIDLGRFASLEFLHAATSLLILAQKAAYQTFSTNLFLPAWNHKSENRTLDIVIALLLRGNRFESALDSERHGCVSTHAKHLLLDLRAGSAWRGLETVCRLENDDGSMRHNRTALCRLCGAVFADSVGGAVKLDHIVRACSGRRSLEVASAVGAMVGKEGYGRPAGFEASSVGREEGVLVDVVRY